MKKIDHPAFRFCSWCGAEGSMVEENGEIRYYYIACRKCLEYRVGDNETYPPQQRSNLIKKRRANRHKDESGCFAHFIKQLLKDPETDQATRTKIAAELLSSNMEGEQ